jgi:hypothetical protein
VSPLRLFLGEGGSNNATVTATLLDDPTLPLEASFSFHDVPFGACKLSFQDSSRDGVHIEACGAQRRLVRARLRVWSVYRLRLGRAALP